MEILKVVFAGIGVGLVRGLVGYCKAFNSPDGCGMFSKARLLASAIAGGVAGGIAGYMGVPYDSGVTLFATWGGAEVVNAAVKFFAGWWRAKKNIVPTGAALRLLCLAGTVVLLAGCTSTVPARYLAADRATYSAVAPVHREYLDSQTCTLDAMTKEAGRVCLDAWRLRLEEAEGQGEDK